MKTKLFIIALLISVTGITFGQTSGIYSAQDFVNQVEYNIYLYKSGSYLIELSEGVTEDLEQSLVLSYGSYHVQKGHLMLTDKVNEFTMVLSLDNDKIMVKKSLICITGRTFELYRKDTGEEPVFFKAGINASSLLTERTNYFKTIKTDFCISYGIYTDKRGYGINIRAENQYSVEYKNIVISKGTWKRDRNELILKDATLRHNFHALIDGGKLVSKLLPGDYAGIILQLR